MESANKGKFVNIILHIIGFLLCIVPAAVCTMLYFPIWREAGIGSCIAGGGALILVICAIPIYKLLRRMLSGASAYMMWLIAFLLFFGLSKIAAEMTVISFVGFVSNLIGAILMKIGGKKDEQERI